MCYPRDRWETKIIPSNGSIFTHPYFNNFSTDLALMVLSCCYHGVIMAYTGFSAQAIIKQKLHM